MILIRSAVFAGYLIMMLPLGFTGYLIISHIGEQQVQNLHFDTPGGKLVEPFAKWFLDNRYATIAGGMITGAYGLAKLRAKKENRKIDRLLGC